MYVCMEVSKYINMLPRITFIEVEQKELFYVEDSLILKVL